MKMNLPEEFVNRMKELLGDEYDEFISSYEDGNYHGLRINPLKLSQADEVVGELTNRPVPWCATGYYYDEDSRPGRHPYHHAGAYYIQEPSAMIVGTLADAKPGMRVLDLCAAPGGKTSHLAGNMQGEGVLVANEIVPGRAKILSQNVERMGIRNAIVTNESPDRLARSMSGYFDLVVVDAPCSGEGMFRRDEIARDEWSAENVKMCAERGQDILDAADVMLRVGGKLVYSTCTFAPDEDEQAIVNFINSHPMYKVAKTVIERSKDCEATDGWPDPGRSEWGTQEDLSLTYRLWPHRLHGEGHYVAVLTKGDLDLSGKTSAKGKKNVDNKLKNAVALYEQWAKKNLIDLPVGEYMLFGDSLNLVPFFAPDITRTKVERVGLKLGEIKKDRFEPDHALAMALRPDECKNVYNINITADESSCGETIKYLRGESLNVDNMDAGWCIVTVNGVSVGWGKVTGNILKNHYPKGLRIKM